MRSGQKNLLKRVAIAGSALGGGAAQVIDAIRRGFDYDAVGIFDNNEEAWGKDVDGVKVVGSSKEIVEAYRSGLFDAVVIAVGDVVMRRDLFEVLKLKLVPFCNVIDKDAIISPSAKIGIGNVFLCHSYVGPGVTIGDNCYIITGSRINHDSQVGSHCYLSTGVSIAGRVRVGDLVKFETASGSAPDCHIPSGSTVPPGQIVIKTTGAK